MTHPTLQPYERADAVAAEVHQRFGGFLRDRVNVSAAARDRDGSPIPRELLSACAELGLLGFSLPAAVGGEARDKFDWGIVIEEASALCEDGGLTPLLDMNIGIIELILATGRADLIESYARPMASGHIFGMPAAYESRDPFDYATRARQVEGGWVLTGQKEFVAGAQFADVMLVYARDEASEDILSFLIERHDGGVTIAPLATTGARSMGFGVLTLDEVWIPAARLLHAADAQSAMHGYIRNRRVMTAAQSVGRMRAITAQCVRQLAGRQRGGRPVVQYGNVQATIGSLHAAIEVSHAMLIRALAETQSAHRDPDFDPITTVAKHFVTEQAIQVGLAILDLMGGEGYMQKHPWERYMRDTLALIGGQGAQELLLVQLGQRALLDMKAKELRALRRDKKG